MLADVCLKIQLFIFALSLSRFLFLSITKAFSFCRTKLLPFQVISQDLHLFQPSINLASWMFTEYFSGMQATIWFSVPPTISSSNICIGIIVFSQEATNKPLPRCRMDSGGFFRIFCVRSGFRFESMRACAGSRPVCHSYTKHAFNYNQILLTIILRWCDQKWIICNYCLCICWWMLGWCAYSLCTSAFDKRLNLVSGHRYYNRRKPPKSTDCFPCQYWNRFGIL